MAAKKTVKKKVAKKAKRAIVVKEQPVPASRKTIAIVGLVIVIAGFIFLGGAKLDDAPPEMEPGAVYTTTQDEAISLTGRAMQLSGLTGEVTNATYNSETEEWLVIFEAVREGKTAQVETTVKDKEIKKIAFMLPIPELAPVAEGNDPAIGPADAPVLVIEYSGLACEPCRIQHKIIKQVLEAYPDDVRFVFKNFPLQNDESQNAAMASECAYKAGMFEEYFYALAEAEDFSLLNLKLIAADLGISGEVFMPCLEDHTILDEINADAAEGKDVGVSIVPTFFINNRKYEGVGTLEAFEDVISKEVGGA